MFIEKDWATSYDDPKKMNTMYTLNTILSCVCFALMILVSWLLYLSYSYDLDTTSLESIHQHLSLMFICMFMFISAFGILITSLITQYKMKEDYRRKFGEKR